MVLITQTWLHQHCSNPAQSAWTRAQLEVLGISWPPPVGWKQSLLGRRIDDATADAFARAATCYRPKTLRLRRKEAQAILNRSW